MILLKIDIELYERTVNLIETFSSEIDPDLLSDIRKYIKDLKDYY